MSSRGRREKEGWGKGLRTEATAGHLFLLSAVKCKKCLMPSTAERTPNKQAFGVSCTHTQTHTHTPTTAPTWRKGKATRFQSKIARQPKKKKENAGEKSIPNRSNWPGFLWDYVECSGCRVAQCSDLLCEAMKGIKK